MSSGRSRMNSSTITKVTAPAAATTNVALRHPLDSVIFASAGRNTSWPVALAAESAPNTRPRRSSNHRVATTAARTMEVTPVPAPTSTPQNSMSCHWVCMRVESATAATSSAIAASTIRRSPNRSMTEAANGPIRPKSAMLIATASEMIARFHPNSCSSGTMSTPGVARMPAVISSTTNVAAAITQA